MFEVANEKYFEDDSLEKLWEMKISKLEDELGTGMEHIKDRVVEPLPFTEVDEGIAKNLSPDLKANSLLLNKKNIHDELFEIYAVPAAITIKNWKRNFTVRFVEFILQNKE